MQSEQQQQETQEESKEMRLLKSRLESHTKSNWKPFYHWVETTHTLRYKNSNGNCCFVDIIGRPQKEGKDMPLLPYQNLLYRMLHERKLIWIKKSRGLGVTTFFLNWIAYCCLTKWKPGDRVCVVVGPRIDLAADWIARFRGLFKRNFPSIYSELIKQQSTVTILNGIKVEGFPSHHVDTIRGLDNVKFIMSDESDYYPPFQQKDVRAVCEGYISKPNSNSTIIFVSTPKAPNGLMQQIELEQSSMYYKMFFDYHYGLEGPQPIYSKEQIEKAKLSPDFGREFEGKYLGLVGNVFSQLSIENATKIEYNPDNIVPEAKKSMGLDPAWGSPSNFAIVVTQFVDGKIQVIFADEYPRPFFQAMIDEVFELKQRLGQVTNIYCDSANPEIIQELKRGFNEPYDNQYVKEKIAWCRKHRLLVEDYMTIVPINFTDGPNLVAHTKALLESPDNLIAIHPRYEKLLTSLRTAMATEMKLEKSETSYDDVLDAARMALSFYRMGN